MSRPDTTRVRRDTPPAGGQRSAEGLVEGLNEYGEGWMSSDGIVVKSSRTCPGDRVRLSWTDSGKRYERAAACELLSPSPRRVDPACAAFLNGCGGCQWLHVDYALQLEEKRRIVADQLSRQRLRVPVEPVAGMARPEAYRSKMSLSNADGRPAYLKEYSHEALVPETCRVEAPELQAAWAVLRGIELPPEVLQVHLRGSGGPEPKVSACLFVKRLTRRARDFAESLMGTVPGLVGVGADSYRHYENVAGASEIVIELGGCRYAVPHNGFFQTNLSQALVLREIALAELAAGTGDRVLDLYCGVGFFSLPLARGVGRVVGVEENAAAVAAATANATLNGVTNARFVASDSSRALAAFRPGDFNRVLLDPPRSGCEPAALAALIRLAPERIVYVSCDPGSLARDLRQLADAGWRVETCRPVDLFPHTAHVETVVRLVRTPRGAAR